MFSSFSLSLLFSISVEDLRSIRPMENEAEHYLIQAMEARDPLVPVEGTKGGDEYSSTAAVLSNILPEDLDALRVEEPTADGASVGSNGSNRGSIDNMGIGSQSSSSRSLFQPNKSTRQNKPTRGPSHMRHRRMETVRLPFCALFICRIVVDYQELTHKLKTHTNRSVRSWKVLRRRWMSFIFKIWILCSKRKISPTRCYRVHCKKTNWIQTSIGQPQTLFNKMRTFFLPDIELRQKSNSTRRLHKRQPSCRRSPRNRILDQLKQPPLDGSYSNMPSLFPECIQPVLATVSALPEVSPTTFPKCKMNRKELLTSKIPQTQLHRLKKKRKSLVLLVNSSIAPQ